MKSPFSIDPDQTAFPCDHSSTFGLTKREFLAGLALAGLLGNTEFANNSPREDAETAVRAADALIEALSRQEE